MTVQTQVIRFQKDSSGTADVTQDVTLSFTPKALYLISDANTADDTVSAHYQICQGLSDGTNYGCLTVLSRDALASSDTWQIHGDGVFVRLSETTGAVSSRATCTFGTNKVTFTWVVNDTASTYITLWAIGGTDITNVKVNTVQVGTTSLGNQDYTGLGFNPVDNQSVIFTLSTFFGALDTISAATTTHNFGCAVSSSKQWCLSNVSEDGRPTMDTWRRHDTNNCMNQLAASTGGIQYLAGFNSWITDGFRLTYNDASPFSTYVFTYMVIKGGNWDCGNLQSPTTATNDVDTTISVNSQTPRGLFLASIGETTINSTTSNGLITLGATDGTNSGTVSVIDEDAQADSDTYRINNASNIIKAITTDGAILEVANFDSFPTNSSFRLDWPTANAGAIYYGWVVVADAAAAAAVTEEERRRGFGSSLEMFEQGIGDARSSVIFG